jgi:quercetin dioxygenase-like cupin family protein
MHETPTTDYAVLLSGQLDLLLDDGPALRLGVGDVVVQRHTNHSWINMGVEPARLLVVMHGETQE